MAKGYRPPKVGGPMNMLEQIQKLQEQIHQVQEQLAQEMVTGSAGGGAVKVTLSGDQQCKAVEIDPALLQEADVEMLQDLLLTAFNSALQASRNLAGERLGPLAGNLPF